MKYLLNISLVILLHACQYETERSDRYELQGIDVSHYQSYINWPAIAQQGISFAFIKATEGKEMHDTLFCHNWNEIWQAGLKRGAYHFFDQLFLPKSKQKFYVLADLQVGDLPPVLDVEVLDGASQQQLLEGIKTWLELVEIHYEIKPILYTNLNFITNYSPANLMNIPFGSLVTMNVNPSLPVAAIGNSGSMVIADA